MQLEGEARQVAHALLTTHKKAAAVAERKVREQYESKLRQKQMQLTAVQNQLQVRTAFLSLSLGLLWV